MKYLWLFLLCSFPSWSICPDRLARQLEQQWTEPTARLGIVVRTPERVIVDRQGEQAFIPASLQKLFTTAVALQKLGAEFRTSTSVTVGEDGKLHLRGGGDPSFTSDRSLPALVAQIKPGNVAIAQIEWESEPWGNSYGYGWEWADLQAPYAPPAGGVVIDGNVLPWRLDPSFSWQFPDRAFGWQVENQVQLGTTDTLQIQVQGQKLLLRGTIPEPIEYATPIPDPPQQFINLLQAELQRQNLTEVAVGTATWFSPPLQELIKITNKESNNLYAEQILRLLGRQFRQPNQDYATTGRDLITQAVPTPGFYAADGSGLSRHNQVTPHQVAHLLLQMADNLPFRQSLPQAGRDGTLTNRLSHLSLQAKTGTLRGIATLAGYLTPPRHPPVIVVIMVNHSLLPTALLRQQIDRFVTTINDLELCERSRPSP
ncbi:MAG: D-alanyl-D-alanine carboxypeptidase/D-alanyl-D-alanine-endopeptidase [Pseudanabaenaceae cyanobacterium]